MAKPTDPAALIDYARSTAKALEHGSHDLGLATSGVEFLRRYAGPESTYYSAALRQVES
jgi:hypothetical protein